eukprot:scaffold477397_cov19-Prasinocladus_malaysianus.AAC.1
MANCVTWNRSNLRQPPAASANARLVSWSYDYIALYHYCILYHRCTARLGGNVACHGRRSPVSFRWFGGGVGLLEVVSLHILIATIDHQKPALQQAHAQLYT